MKPLISGIIATFLLSTTAFADYTRIWRGFPLEGLSQNDFIEKLNHELFPATGALAHKSAKLTSYLPVVLPEAENALPGEIALLSYESEADYRAYRATAEGKHYGDLHWQLFQRDLSKSLVPEPYVGTLGIEKAYEVIPKGPSYVNANFQLQKRDSRQDAHAYLKSIEKTIKQRRQDSKLVGYYLLIADQYYLEYLFKSDQPQINPVKVKTSSDTLTYSLARAKKIAKVGGLDYPVKWDSAREGVRDIWTHHIDAWNARDLDELMVDYRETSVLIHNDAVYRGRAEIRNLFAQLFDNFDQVLDTGIDRVTAESNVIYITWWALDDNGLAQGTDTFVIDSDFISVQTIMALPSGR
jgi:hypothetical protein